MATAKIMSETANTDTPRERAFALYCQGQRSPAIATKLGVPERTVRLWISSILRKLAEENTAQRREHQALAIARYEAISNAAWEGYARAAALEQATLQSTLAPESVAESATPSSPSVSTAVPPSLAREGGQGVRFSGARYLAVAMAADREISRLQGLYLPEATKPHNDVHIILERREPTAENYPPGESPDVPIPGAPPTDPIAPAPARAHPARDGGLCGGTPVGAVLTAGSPDTAGADSSAGSPTATPLGADTSAGSLPPARARAGGQGVRPPETPAESATPSPSSSVSSVPSAVSPSAPNMPRIWKHHPNSPYRGIYITYGDSGANGFGYRP